MRTLREFLQDVAFRISSPMPKFQKDDSVQHITGGPLMVVEWVKQRRGMSTIVFCKWYDRERKSNKTNIFAESDLKVFDWYHPDSM